MLIHCVHIVYMVLNNLFLVQINILVNDTMLLVLHNVHNAELPPSVFFFFLGQVDIGVA